MLYFSSDDGYTLMTSKNELDKLNPALKEKLLNACSYVADDFSEIILDRSERELVLEVFYTLKGKENNARRSLQRSEVEMSNSAGYYTSSDIREIIRLQDQCCYFTGEALNLSNKNWEVDHLTPVSKGGSSWPGNLAVVTKSSNQKKHGRSKQQYWEMLEVQHGEEWAYKRRAIANEIDKKRKKLHTLRVQELKNDIARISSSLQHEFPDQYISLHMEKDIICMNIGAAEICFPKGLPRKRALFKTSNYFCEVARLFTY